MKECKTCTCDSIIEEASKKRQSMLDAGASMNIANECSIEILTKKCSCEDKEESPSETALNRI